MIGGQIHAGTPENAMYGFALFYAICLVINWWFYLRKNAYVRKKATFHIAFAIESHARTAN